MPQVASLPDQHAGGKKHTPKGVLLVNQTRYKQCELQRAGVRQIAWIPEVLAREGLLVTVDDSAPNLWAILKVYSQVREGPSKPSSVFGSIKEDE